MTTKRGYMILSISEINRLARLAKRYAKATHGGNAPKCACVSLEIAIYEEAEYVVDGRVQAAWDGGSELEADVKRAEAARALAIL